MLEINAITDRIIGSAFRVSNTLDLLVEEQVLIELKATKCLNEFHTAQCLNYLNATGLKVCLLMNFGSPRVDVKRLVNHW